MNAFIENNPESFYLGEDCFVMNNDVLDLKSKNISAIKKQVFNYKFFPESTFVHIDYYVGSRHFKETKKYEKYLELLELFITYIKKEGIDYLDAVFNMNAEIKMNQFISFQREIKNNWKNKEEISKKTISKINKFFKKHGDVMKDYHGHEERFESIFN